MTKLQILLCLIVGIIISIFILRLTGILTPIIEQLLRNFL